MRTSISKLPLLLFLSTVVAFVESSIPSEFVIEEEGEDGQKQEKKAEDYLKDWDKACPKFKCAGGLTPVPKSRQKYESSGCGGMQGGAGMITVSNDEKEDEQAFSPCCDQWHACYSICGMAKNVCDAAYKTCWEKRCRGNEECEKNADMAGIFIKFGGCAKYDSAQYMACECVSKTKAEDKRELAIERFYKKYAPDNVDKAAELSAKAKDSASKTAGLLQKLLTKYPSAIKKIVDEAAELYKKAYQEQEKKEAEEEAAAYASGRKTESTQYGDILAEQEKEEEEVQEL